MKKIYLIPLLLSFVFSLHAQNFKLNTDEFTSKSKALFDAAKKRFVNETGDKTSVQCGNFAACYATTLQFNDGTSFIAIDNDNIKHHLTKFTLGNDLNDAKRIYDLMRSIIKSIMPQKFAEKETYEADYEGYKIHYYEYDSEIFAQTAKQPSAKIGIKKKDDKYIIELLFIEPVFK